MNTGSGSWFGESIGGRRGDAVSMLYSHTRLGGYNFKMIYAVFTLENERSANNISNS